MAREKLLFGLGRLMVPLPQCIWRLAVARDRKSIMARIKFLSPDHHKVRDFVVRQLPEAGAALPAALISSQTGLAEAAVAEILDELERNLTFVVRDRQGQVAWAYPVTAEPTPHLLHFPEGHTTHAA